MIDPIKVIDVIKGDYRFPLDFEVVEKYETVDALWGMEHRELTDTDIKALKEGKYLYCDNGEYAQIISYNPQAGGSDNK